MPIYEFYCPDCHTVFSFFSAAVDTTASPACPRCRRPGLGRKPSSFAMLKGSPRGGDEEPAIEGIDDERMAGAMESVLSALPEGAEDDPRQMARMLRQFGAAAGMEPGPKMEEILARLESGEDPQVLEGEMGEGPGEDGGAMEDFFRAKRAARARAGKPRVDKELHFL